LITELMTEKVGEVMVIVFNERESESCCRKHTCNKN
jgi:hypothetical protein